MTIKDVRTARKASVSASYCRQKSAVVATFDRGMSCTTNHPYQTGLNYSTSAVVCCHHPIASYVARSRGIFPRPVSRRCYVYTRSSGRHIRCLPISHYDAPSFALVLPSATDRGFPTGLRLPRPNGLACIVRYSCLRECAVGASRNGSISGVIEGLPGIVFDDDDSDRSVSDIDEAVIASEQTC